MPCFELCDAALCVPAPVGSVPSLSLEPVFRRSHGSLYKALAKGRIDDDRLRKLLVANRPPHWPMVFAVDASTWDRCDAECSPERGFYYSASKHSAGQPIVAGWSYQWICQLDWASDSWTAPLDTQRITPFMDATTASIDQVRRLVSLLPTDGDIPLFVFDAGYDPVAIGHDLKDLRAEVLCRIRGRPGLLRRPTASPQPSGRDRRASSTAREAVQVLRAGDLAGALGKACHLRSPLRHRHGHGLARGAPTALVPGSLVGLRGAPDRPKPA